MTTQQIDMHAAIERISTSTPAQGVRTLTSAEFAIGKCAHQGDIYVHRVAADHPRGQLLGTYKLAIGETIGSRHFAEGSSVEVYEGVKPPSYAKDALLGPVVVAKQAWRNTHPVHAEFCNPAGTFQVTHQLDWRQQQRVAD